MTLNGLNFKINKKMKKLSLFLFLLSLTYITQAQNNNTVKNNAKNDFYLSLGYGGVAAAVNLNYERKLWTPNYKLLASFWIKANGGVWAIWDSYGSLFSLAGVGLVGQKNHHIEYSLGTTTMYDKAGYDSGISNYNGGYYDSKPTKKEYTDLSLYAALGYRYQKPGNGFLFRAGFGFPEMFYVSFGYSL